MAKWFEVDDIIWQRTPSGNWSSFACTECRTQSAPHHSCECRANSPPLSCHDPRKNHSYAPWPIFATHVAAEIADDDCDDDIARGLVMERLDLDEVDIAEFFVGWDGDDNSCMPDTRAYTAGVVAREIYDDILAVRKNR